MAVLSASRIQRVCCIMLMLHVGTPLNFCLFQITFGHLGAPKMQLGSVHTFTLVDRLHFGRQACCGGEKHDKQLLRSKGRAMVYPTLPTEPWV